MPPILRISLQLILVTLLISCTDKERKLSEKQSDGIDSFHYAAPKPKTAPSPQKNVESTKNGKPTGLTSSKSGSY